MNSESEFIENQSNVVAKLPLLAAIVALIGLADSIYLTIKHFTGEQVPCSIVEGCEQVLTSSFTGKIWFGRGWHLSKSPGNHRSSGRTPRRTQVG